jgi:hypothetical protein
MDGSLGGSPVGGCFTGGSPAGGFSGGSCPGAGAGGGSSAGGFTGGGSSAGSSRSGGGFCSGPCEARKPSTIFIEACAARSVPSGLCRHRNRARPLIGTVLPFPLLLGACGDEDTVSGSEQGSDPAPTGGRRSTGDTGVGGDGGAVGSAGAPESSTPGPAPVLLGSAENYVLLAMAGISNVPTSAVTGNLGLSPAAASYITGFALTRVGKLAIWT